MDALLAGLPGADTLLQQVLPCPWKAAPQGLCRRLPRALRAGRHKGFGMFARHHVFTLEDGRLTPVRYPTRSA